MTFTSLNLDQTLEEPLGAFDGLVKRVERFVKKGVGVAALAAALSAPFSTLAQSITPTPRPIIMTEESLPGQETPTLEALTTAAYERVSEEEPIGARSYLLLWGEFGIPEPVGTPSSHLPFFFETSVGRVTVWARVLGTTMQQQLPLHYAGGEQVNVVAPDPGVYALTVRVGDRVSNTRLFTVVPSRITLLQNNGVVAATTADHVIYYDAPATAGSFVTVYAQGGGVPVGMPPLGEPTPMPQSSGDLLSTVKPVVMLDGKQLLVSWAGLTPGFPSLWQYNIWLPEGLSPGAYDLVFSLDGHESSRSVLVGAPGLDGVGGLLRSPFSGARFPVAVVDPSKKEGVGRVVAVGETTLSGQYFLQLPAGRSLDGLVLAMSGRGVREREGGSLEGVVCYPREALLRAGWQVVNRQLYEWLVSPTNFHVVFHPDLVLKNPYDWLNAERLGLFDPGAENDPWYNSLMAHMRDTYASTDETSYEMLRQWPGLPERPVRVYFGKLPEPFRSLYREALRESGWNKHSLALTGKPLFVEVADGTASPDGPSLLTYELSDRNNFAWHDFRYVTVRLPDGRSRPMMVWADGVVHIAELSTKTIEAAIMLFSHEGGHALGEQHDYDKESPMYWKPWVDVRLYDVRRYLQRLSMPFGEQLDTIGWDVRKDPALLFPGLALPGAILDPEPYAPAALKGGVVAAFSTRRAATSGFSCDGVEPLKLTPEKLVTERVVSLEEYRRIVRFYNTPREKRVPAAKASSGAPASSRGSSASGLGPQAFNRVPSGLYVPDYHIRRSRPVVYAVARGVAGVARASLVGLSYERSPLAAETAAREGLVGVSELLDGRRFAIHTLAYARRRGVRPVVELPRRVVDEGVAACRSAA